MFRPPGGSPGRDESSGWVSKNKKLAVMDQFEFEWFVSPIFEKLSIYPFNIFLPV